MHERPERILDIGHAGPDGRRGVVVRYPRSHDYFRRLLARIGADQTAAAMLLSMVQCILAPIREADCRGGQLHRAAVMRWAAKNPHMFDEHFDKLLHFPGYCARTQEKRDANEDACALDFEPRKETEPCSD